MGSQRQWRGQGPISPLLRQSAALSHASTTRIASYTRNDRVVSSPDEAVCARQDRGRALVGAGAPGYAGHIKFVYAADWIFTG